LHGVVHSFFATPLGAVLNMPDDGLTAFMNVDMFNGDLLLASRSMTF
jgi:hypothetical protein